MDWKENEDLIFSNHRDIESFDKDSIEIVYVDKERGIFLFAGNLPKSEEGSDVGGMYEQSFAFLKEDGWDLEKAKSWFYANRGKESFSWVGDVEVVPGKKLIRGKAIHPVKTYHPNEWPKVRKYLESELKASAESLVGVPLILDHWRILPYKVTGAKYEDGALEFVAECDDEVILQKIRNKAIAHMSPEFKWGILEHQEDGSIAPKNIKFSALSLLEFLPPGDPQSTVEVWEGVMNGVGKHIATIRELGEFLAGTKRPTNIIKAKPADPALQSLEDHLEWSLLKERTIIFHGYVGQFSCEKALRRLEFLANESSEPIRVILNSVGGGVYDGLLVYDTIRKLAETGTNIVCEARGLAASMGSILLQGGTERVATPNTRFLIHEVSDFMWGKTSEIEDEVEELKKVNEMMVKILAERTGRSPEEIHKIWHKKDVWMSAEEALRFGLIDKIEAGDPKLAKAINEYTFLKESLEISAGQPTGFSLTPEEVDEILGEPFGGFKNWEACEKAHADKKNPAAYCAAIKAKTEEAKLAEARAEMFQEIADLRKELNESKKAADLSKEEAAVDKANMKQLIEDVESALPRPEILRFANATGTRTVQSVKTVLLKYKEKSN